MKSCVIYKTFKNEYKIVPQSETTAGYMLYTLPIYILPINCSGEAFLSDTLKALDSSSKRVKAPDREEFPQIQRNLLFNLKEKSFTNLYLNSTSCEIRVEKSDMNIYPNKLMTKVRPKDGLIWVKEDAVTINKFEKNHNLIISNVLKILEFKY